MVTLMLLAIIYMAFISLGLPDALLGVTWPIMQTTWNLPVDAIGLVSMTVIGFSIISSFLSGRIINRFGTGMVTFISCGLTGTALLGIAYAPSFIWLILLAAPLGFGGGSVDAALNNYVALHFKAHHMNWLHSFWGVGATLGPVIMASYIGRTGLWHGGYKTVASIQLSLMVILFFALPLWKKHEAIHLPHTDETERENTDLKSSTENKQTNHPIQGKLWQIKGLPYALLTILMYCAIEHGVGLWGSTFLVNVKDISAKTAASWVGLYYGGITIGRFISGFIAFKLNSKQLMRLGMLFAFIGGTILVIGPSQQFMLIGLIILGMGLAPIFPGMIHETPSRFGRQNSQRIIGMQMGFAYIGSAFLSPLWGTFLKSTSIGLFPILVSISIILLILSSERVIALTKEARYD